MQIDLTLISVERFLLIGLIGAFIVPAIAITEMVLFSFNIYLFFGTILGGYLLLYFALRYYTRYNGRVSVDEDSIKIEEQIINWDSLVSFDYDETLIFAGFIFRTKAKSYRLTGLLKGSEAEKFIKIANEIDRIIVLRNLQIGKSKLEQKNFYNSKWAKPTALITIGLAIIFTIWIMYSVNEIKAGLFLKLGVLYIMIYLQARRVFIDKK
jgi:hypothetical protein